MLYRLSPQPVGSLKSIHSLARGLEVIRVLNQRPRMTLAQLSQRTGIPKSTLIRILRTLIAEQWVYRYRADGSYRLGSAICHLGQHVLTTDQMVEKAAPMLDRLYETVGRPSELAVCTGAGMRVLDSTHGAYTRMGNHEPANGHYNMLWSALGRAYLAFCPDAECERILDHLRHCPNPLDQAAHNHRWVDGLLDETRSRGYATVEPGHGNSPSNGRHGLEIIAVPVRSGGQVQACINLVRIDGEDGSGGIHDPWLSALNCAACSIGRALERVEVKEIA